MFWLSLKKNQNHNTLNAVISLYFKGHSCPPRHSDALRKGTSLQDKGKQVKGQTKVNFQIYFRAESLKLGGRQENFH